MFRQAQFDSKHSTCATCGDCFHVSELNGVADCALCAENKIDRALAQAQHAFNIALIDANLTPTSANYENSVIAYLAGN